MDVLTLQRWLAQAEDFVRQGEKHLSRQRNLVERMERSGHDAGLARDLLAIFEEWQIAHLAHRDRLRRELALTEDATIRFGKPTRP